MLESKYPLWGPSLRTDEIEMVQHDIAAPAAAKTERAVARKVWQPPCIEDVSVTATAATKQSSSMELGTGKAGS